MRRVVKSGGYIFLLAAWNVPSWYSQGYEVRPFSDFGLQGKLVKASIPLRSTTLFRAAYLLPIRFLRYNLPAPGGSQLRYQKLAPNYEHYWSADSDAACSVDHAEAIRWFTSRGDKCLNCSSAWAVLEGRPLQSLVLLRVNKS